MASSRSEENVNLKHFQKQNGVTVLVSPVILWTLMFLILVWQMLLPMILGNLILFVADVIAMLPFVLATWVLFGWCYCHVALLYDRW